MTDGKTPEIYARVKDSMATLNATFEGITEKIFRVNVEPSKIVDAVRILVQNLGVRHLSTITGLDLDDKVEIDYQFSYADRIITVKTLVPKTHCAVESCTSVLPGVILYEMEVHDMFGVAFNGNPWMDRKLLLPDNYPSGLPPPLLKSTSSETIRKAVGVEKE